MDLEKTTMIKCKCLKEFAVNVIQNHLAQQPICKSKFSQEELSELKELCNAHKKQKRSQRDKASYQKKKNITKVETSPSPSTSKCQNSGKKAEESTVLKPTEVKCLGCQKTFQLQSIQYHLKMKVSCQNMYSKTDYADLKNVCDSHKKEKRAVSKSSYKQSQKVVARPKEEIDTIIKTMKEVREHSMQMCMNQLSEFVKMFVYMLREMKEFFNNHALVEMDIQEYIATTFLEFNDVYDHSMKEIVWTMEFLLSNPSVSIDEEVADLKNYLFYQTLSDYLMHFPGNNVEAYKDNIMRQLPEKVRKKFQKKIDREYYINMGYPGDDFPEYILYPFQDPAEFWYFEGYPDLPLPKTCYKKNFVDEVTLYLDHLCKVCGKHFTSVPKHLSNPSITCGKHFSKQEMEEIKVQPEEVSKFQNFSKSNILQKNFENVNEIRYLINECIEDNFDPHYVDIFSMLNRIQIVRSKGYDMPNLFDKYDIPVNLVTKHKESVKQANEMYDLLEEKYYNLKSQVIDEINQVPENELKRDIEMESWMDPILQIKWVYIHFIQCVARNFLVYLCNERVKIESLLWETLQDIAKEIGVELKDAQPYHKRYHTDTYTHSHDHLSRRFDDQNQKFLNENLDRYVAKKQDLFDCFKRSKKEFEEFMQPEFYLRTREVYEPLPGIYTAIWNCRTAVVNAKPFSWFNKNELRSSSTPWWTRDLETIPSTSFQSWLM